MDTQLSQDETQGVAIIGMSGRFPGADDVQAFWRNLTAGVESISRLSDAQLSAGGVDPALLSNPDYVKARGLLDGVEMFDAAFFGYAPGEAARIDPQHRLFLECASEALEDAGYDPERYAGAVGVYAGQSLNTYLLHNLCPDRRTVEELTGAFQVGHYPTLTGNDKDYLASRVSYKLNLRGPSVVVQTACSTSLVAVCQAVQSLLTYQCEIALAGGVSIAFPQHRGYLYQEGSIASPDGRCRAFDARAQGTVFGAGCGVVVLKRLADALADGDRIDAVIRGAALNNDGAAKFSFSAPSPDGQAEVIALAHALADVSPDSITYVEAHGTGTPMGDPIEVEGLTRAFRMGTDRKQFCALGSLKPNVGHLEAASGVAGLIKTALALKHRLLPPTLHFERPNPRIDFAGSPFYVNAQLMEWQAGPTPRRAGVSSFGVGGANAHVVLEEALTPPPPLSQAKEGEPLVDTAEFPQNWGVGGASPQAGGKAETRGGELPQSSEETVDGKRNQLLLLSAKTASALDRMTANLAAHLRDHTEIDLADAAYTLQVGRRLFEHRRMLVCRDREEAVAALEAPAPSWTRVCLSSRPSVAFLFPGQGAQQIQMGRELYEAEPLFRAEIDRGAEILTPLLGQDPRALLYPSLTTEATNSQGLLNQTRFTQPLLFLVEYALARLWMHWGVQPQAMIGHSLGEYTAACLAGVFTLEEALGLLVERGRLMQSLPSGAMTVVRLPEEELRALLPASLALAAVNGPTLCTISGPHEEIERLEREMEARGVACRRLETSHAFHSAMMDPILDAFAERVGQVALRPPQIPYLSNLTGSWITPEQATDPAYWTAHLRQTVRFSAGLDLLLEASDRVLLEVGPGRTLGALVRRHPSKTEAQILLASLGDPKQERSEHAALIEALGRLWLAGVEIDWAAYHAPNLRRRVSLPTYPFERVRCWVEPVRSYVQQPEITQAIDGQEIDRLEIEPPVETEDTLSEIEMEPSENQNPISRIEAALLEQLHEMTGIAPEAIDPAASFLEMGLDSLFLTQAGQAFQNRFKVKITFRHLLEDYPTPRALAAYIEAQSPKETPLPAAKQSLNHRRSDRCVAPSIAERDTEAQRGHREEKKDERKGNLGNVGALLAAPSPTVAPSPDAPTDAPISEYLNTRTPGALTPNSTVEQVIQQQLKIMAQQLALLRGEAAFTPQGAGNEDVVGEGAASSAPTIALSSTAASQKLPLTRKRERGAGGESLPAVQNGGAHGPFRPFQRGGETGLSDQQQTHLDALIARYVARTPGSKAQTRRHRSHLADPRVAAGFRAPWKEMVYPIAAARSAGSRIWDVDGNEFVDVTMGFGVNLFGHSPEFVTRAVERQLRLGVEIGPQSPLAGQAAERICELIGMERAAFCNTGSEAVMVAMRLARTVTGRDKIAIFTGDYHGTFDEVLVRANIVRGELRTAPIAPGIPQNSLGNILVLDYGAPESLEILKAHADELAAVMVEPVQSRRPDLQPAEFLHAVRNLTEQAGVVLIFDEVITGFRCHLGGAQAHFGVRADLATYGKIVGGGMPIGIVAGRSEYMDALDGGQWEYGDASFPEVGVTFFAGTFVRHPLALAAAVAVLDHLKAQGPALQEELNRRAAGFADTLNADFERHGLPIHIPYFGSIFYLKYEPEWKWGGLLYYYLREKGLHIWEGRPFFLSTAHTDDDITFMIHVFRESVAEMQAGGFLPGTQPLTFASPCDFVSSQVEGSSLPNPRFRGNPPTHIHNSPRIGDRRRRGGANSPEIGGREANSPQTWGAEGVAGEVRDTSDPLPLTEPQREIWLAARQGKEISCAFNESITLHLRGPLDFRALRRAMQQVVDRHEALRATFDPSGETQRIAPALTLEIPRIDLSTLEAAERTAVQEKILAQQGRDPFDLEVGPLLRAQVVMLAKEDQLLVLTAHHIVCDGWSLGVILSELSTLYSAARDGKSADLEPAASFRDYALEQERKQSNTEAEAYWLAQLEGPSPTLDLPSDRPRTGRYSYEGGRERLRIDAELLKSLRKLSARNGCTLNSLLLAAFTTLLRRITGQTDLIVGLPTAGQAIAETAGLVGHCVHLLPLRVNEPSDPSFRDYCAALKRAVLDAYDHQECTFSTLLRKLELPREPGRTPLVSVTFNLDRYPADLAFSGLSLEIGANPRSFFQFDLGFNLIESAEMLEVECDYRADLFDPATIRRWLGGFRTLLEGAIEDADRALSRLPLLTAAERSELLEEWSGRESDAPLDRRIDEIFEEQAARRPDAVALRFEGGVLSYRELNDRADRWARLLRAQNLGPEPLIGLCMERSPEMIVAMLAILKAGGAYVPLDPTYPAERLRDMIDDCELRLVLTQSRLAANLPAGPARRLCVDAEEQAPPTDIHLFASATAGRSTSEGLAYIIYTSGSTGQAKGTAIPHRGVVRLVCQADYVTLDADTVCLHHSSVSFDASTFEIWGPLLNGGSVALLPSGAASLTELEQAVGRHRVNTLWLTAGLFHAFVDHRLDALRPIRQLLAGGDVLSPSHVRRVVTELPDCRLINGYGPTENTTFTCCHTVLPSDPPTSSVPIGRPIGGTRVYVLDPRGELVPIGVPGELYVGGDGLAREYLNCLELTAERFVADPFSKRPGARLYRTGDRVRWAPNGVLEFLGRFDDQIKVRGFRVEPGEIEQALRRHEAIREAAVTADRGATGERRLTAYYVVKPGAAADPEGLKRFLEACLPAYLIPSAFVSLVELPLTSNGKLDRRALPAADAHPQHPAEPLPAPDDRGIELAKLWEKMLGVRQVGLNDDFFALGGDSLLAVRLLAEVERCFGARLPMSALFQAPTAAQMSRLLPGEASAASETKETETEETSKANTPRIAPEEEKEQRRVVPLRKATPSPLLAPIRPSGSRPPLFCVHHVHGTVLCYQALSRHLAPDWPIYGLQGHGVDDMEQPDATLEEIASDCIQAARLVCPEGPYLLCGLSFGGVVAVEMANQLHEQGLPVAFVGLLDTYAPSYFSNSMFSKDKRRSLLARIRNQARALRRLEPSRRGAYLRMLALDMKRAIDNKLRRISQDDEEWTERQEQIVQANLGALRAYSPEPCPVPATLFRAVEQLEQKYRDPLLWWDDVLRDVQVREVFGNHFSLIREPFVQDVAAQMNRALEEAFMQLQPERRNCAPREAKAA